MSEVRYPVTTVDLLRHGDCQDGALLRGITDSPLSQRGWKQMYAALSPHHGWDRMVCSPLQRCSTFAGAFAAEQGIPLSTAASFRELDFGDWEGLTPAQIEARDTHLLQRFFRHPETVTPPNGESLTDARQRIFKAWQELLALYGGKHLLLIIHGGTIRLLLALLLESSAVAKYFTVPTACLTRIQLYHTPEGLYPQLVFHQPEPPSCVHA